MEPRDLSAHSIYQAGRGIEEVARELGMEPGDLVKLSSNENTLGPSPKAIDAIEEFAATVHTYPKASHTDLIDRIAEKHGVTAEQVWLAAGGDGGLDYVHRALLEPSDRILVPEPGFAYYAMSARYHHGEVDTYPLSKADDFVQTVEGVLEHYDGQRVVYLISPHNPTGSEMTRDQVVELADATDDETLIMVDEAYVEFSNHPSKDSLVSERDDVAVLRTFSKAYGLAGLRIGYILTPETWGDAYTRVNTPFAVNKLGLRAALAAIEDDAHVETSIETAHASRAYMYEHIDAPTWESGGNFVLVEVGDAASVFSACQERGVIIRDCTSFGLPDCVRVTTGTESETDRAVSVLNEVLSDR